MSPSRARRYVLRSRMFLIFLISGSLISMTVSTGVIAQQPNTPLAAVSNEAKQYPVGRDCGWNMISQPTVELANRTK